MQSILHLISSRLITLLGLFLSGFLALSASEHEQGSHTVPDFCNSFSTLRQNYSISLAYQDSMHINMSNEEWNLFMARRTQKHQSIFEQNNQIIDAISGYFEQPTENIPGSAYDSLFTWIDDSFFNNYIDVFLLEHFVDYLLPFYEAKADTARLLTLNHIAGFYNAEISRSYDPEAGARAVKYYKRNLDYAHHFASLDPARSAAIPTDYMNLCYTLSALNVVSPSEALALTEDFEQFVKDNQSFMSERLRERSQAYLDRLHSISFRIHVGTATNEADSLAIIKMYEHSPFKTLSLAEMEDTEDSICYYHSKAYMDEIPVDVAYHECDKILTSQLDRFSRNDTIDESLIQQISNNLITTVALMAESGAPEGMMKQRVVFYTYRLVELIQRTRIARDVSFFDYIISSLACDKNIVRHLSSDMKEQFMSELAVRSQLCTVVHVNVVENLALILFDALMRDCPEQFIGVMGCRTVDDLLANRSQLMRYLSMASLFHDLGKNQLTEIVDNDSRRLTQHERAIIERHPALALDYLDIDPMFKQYRDIALGHHKWYNGQGGYPAWFDNTASPWRPFIDLITLCDCMDAATDTMGRSYRKPKTLEQVLEEFRLDAGTRYNPIMVNALLSDHELFDRLNRVLSANRVQHVNSVRSRYLLHGM